MNTFLSLCAHSDGATLSFAVWSLRLQTLTQYPFKEWMIGIRKKKHNVTQEVLKNYKKAYIQEVAVDSLRYATQTRTYTPDSISASLVLREP